MPDPLRGGSSTLTAALPTSQPREVRLAYPRVGSLPLPSTALRPVLGDEAVRELIRRLMQPGHTAEEQVRALLSQGLPAEHLCLHLLSPAARRMGSMWEDDTCSFVDVTLGMGRLQRMLHELGDQLLREVAPDSLGAALLAPVPGEQHTFGVSMVAEFLRRDGWNVTIAPAVQRAEDLVSLVQEVWFDLVAISAATDDRRSSLRALLRDLRRRSKNRELRLLVGGRLFEDQAELVKHLGADGWAPDAREAAELAAKLL